MLAPDIKNLSRDVFDEFDSGIYDSVHKWAPDVEYTLQEGDGILFPPGYMHETRTVAGPSESDTCATSITFNIPLPIRLLVIFSVRLASPAQAVESANLVIAGLDNAAVIEHVLPVIQKLTQGDWFTARVSACGRACVGAYMRESVQVCVCKCAFGAPCCSPNARLSACAVRARSCVRHAGHVFGICQECESG